MSDAPILETPRLRLRPYRLRDVEAMVEGCDDFEVARTTLALPHPYHRADAEQWLATHAEGFRTLASIEFAIERKEDERLIGGISLRVRPEHQRGEIGYLIHRPHWNKGYATEAARRVVAYGFDDLRLHRIDSHFFAGNEASGRVMQRCGLRFEGLLRQHVFRWGAFHDLVWFGRVREDAAP